MMESALSDLCNLIVRQKGESLKLSRYVPENPRLSKFEKIHACLAKELGIESADLTTWNQNENWVRLFRLMKIRNKMVHANGRINSEELKEAVKAEYPKLTLERQLIDDEIDDDALDDDAYDKHLKDEAKIRFGKELNLASMYRPIGVTEDFIPSVLDTLLNLLLDIQREIEKRS